MTPSTFNYTIYLPNKEYASVLSFFEEKHPDSTLNVEGEIDSWQQVLLELDFSSIRITSLVREKPGDKFSKTVLGTYNWVRNRDNISLNLKEKLLRQISESQLILGIRSINLDPFESCLLLTQNLAGCLFDGNKIYKSSEEYID